MTIGTKKRGMVYWDGVVRTILIGSWEAVELDMGLQDLRLDNKRSQPDREG
jgi:hypothetical protein